MNKKTAQNAINRLNWLQDFLNGTIKLGTIEPANLRDAKAFSMLSIENLFDKISYNTLKNFLRSTPNDYFRNHTFGNNWLYFLSIRERSYALLLEKRGESSTLRPSDEPLDLNLAKRNSLWHASLCANAYLELRRDIQGILRQRSDSPELDYRRLEKLLKKSWSTYETIISSDLDAPPPKLRIVKV